MTSIEEWVRQWRAHPAEFESWSQALETLNGPALLLTEEHRVQAANASFYRCFSASAEETLGTLVYELRGGQWDIPSLRRLIQETAPGEQGLSEYDVDHVFGELGRRILRINTRRLDGSGFLLISVYDLTEQAHERELQDARSLQQVSTCLIRANESDVLNQALVDAAVDLMRADTGTMQLFDERAGGLRLLASRGVPTGLVQSFAFVPTAAATSCAEAIRRSERAIVISYASDTRFTGTTDAQAHLDAGITAAQSTPLISRSGRVLGVLTTHWYTRHLPDERRLRLMDILARQAADAVERQQAEQDVRQLNAALREASRRKDNFLAILAHELRNPLAPLRSALSLLEMTGDDPAVFARTRQMMERQLAQMVRLIDDLLDVSRITRDKIQLRKQRTTLDSALRQALDSTAPLFAAKELQLAVAVPDVPVHVDGDPFRLSQVFTNLLTNAAKYTDARGQVHVSVQPLEAEVVVSIRDDGIGIAVEHLPQLFDMFSQVTEALERAQGGLGIGLALAKALVELHGGHIEARSEGEGKGSEFLVRLPLADSQAPIAGTTRDARVKRANGTARCVLVVDDEPDIVESLTLILEHKGHRVHIAADGESAVQAALELQFDVALLDVGLPKMNGYEAAQRIRQELGARSPLLIAMTGWGQAEDKRRALAAGFDHHFTKPVELSVLDELLGDGGAVSRRVRSA